MKKSYVWTQRYKIPTEIGKFFRNNDGSKAMNATGDVHGEIDINEGALTVNFVATELANKGVSLHYHDKKQQA